MHFDGHAHLLLSGAGVEEAGFFQLFGVAQVELAHEQVEAVEVVAHRQGGHAVDAGLEEFLGFALAELVDDVAALLLGASGEAERRQTGQQQAVTAGVHRDEG
ncbi:hypothetical protein D3C87_1523140 [compost metagenome]